MPDRPRTPDEIREHYEIEKVLAARLRRSTREDRRRLYTEVYDDLFRLVPHHPQLARLRDAEWRSREVARQFGLVKGFLTPEVTYLEVGAGDLSLACEVARHVRRVYAVDVSTEIAGKVPHPANLAFILSDGASIDVPPGSVHVAYSNQLMEHLHPDDAQEQLRNIHGALACNGRYLCITPNRLCGPHDISMEFDEEAAGLHLKEYTNRELAALFMKTGFARTEALCSYQGRVLSPVLPIAPILGFESLLLRLPPSARRALGRALIAIKLVVTK